MAVAIRLTTTTTTTEDDNMSIQEHLSLPILLADRVIIFAEEAQSSKLECHELAKLTTQLTDLLRSTVRLTTTSSTTIYDRPLRRIISEVIKTLDRTLNLVRKCTHRSSPSFLRHLFYITTTADFRKISSLLESSVADLHWLLSIYSSDSGLILSLPPIATNEPNLALVWSCIASVQMGQLKDRVDSANTLASIASDKNNDRVRQTIVQEHGIKPLLNLLKEGPTSEAQVSAAKALFNLASNPERVLMMSSEHAVPLIVKVLFNADMAVQVDTVELVSRMVEMDAKVQEEFGRENVTRPLVILLSMDLVLDEPNPPSLHSIVEMTSHNNNGISNTSTSSLNYNGNGSARNGYGLKNKTENGSAEMKLRLKTSCAYALWKLTKGCLFNSKKITETKGLICLAKLIESEKGELQINCLMTLMELAAVAKCHPELRRVAFKPNLPAGRAVLDQLLRVLNEENSPELLIPAIESIGFLARTFSAKETRIIGHLVGKLEHWNVYVTTEAAIALWKFVDPENFNCVEHSKAIIEFDGVPRLMNLLRSNDRGHVHDLVLLCYLALHVSNSKALEKARALSFLEGAALHASGHNPDLRELIAKAIHHLTIFQAGAHPHRQPYSTLNTRL